MPDYAPNYSQRYVFRYFHAGQGHSFLVRRPRGAEVAHPAVITKVETFLQTLEDNMYSDFSIVDCTFYPQDEFLGVPVDVASMIISPSATDPAGAPPSTKAIQVRFEARGNAGGRGSLSIFSLHSLALGSGIGGDFRLTGSESAVIAAAVNALNELSPAFVPLGSTLAVWRPYANIGYNDYWVNQVRG